MIPSFHYLALAINYNSNLLTNTARVSKITRRIKGKPIICYRYIDKENNRHEHYADLPKGRQLEQIFSARETAAADLIKLRQLWSNSFTVPCPQIDIRAMKDSHISPITKEYFDSLVPCSNPKPIKRPNPYKGIVFRSKSEREIAEILDELHIEYKYEPGLQFDNYEIYADFVCFIPALGLGFIIEHCGMMDSSEYLEKAIRSIRTYNSLGFLPGFNILYTYEKSTCPPSTDYFRTQINALLDTFCAP